MPHPRCDYHVLLVFHMIESGSPGSRNRRITLQVLDPMAFRSGRKERQQIVDAAGHLLMHCGWLSRIVGEGDDPNDYLPRRAMWVQCAQHLSASSATTITILNAWTLVLGLRLNPWFSPYRNAASTTFIHKAYWLFDLALQDRLDWKLLFSFLRMEVYFLDRPMNQNMDVELSGELSVSEQIRDTHPPVNRRIDLRVKGFVALLSQENADDGPQHVVRPIDPSTRLSLDDIAFKTHTEDFTIDIKSEDFIKTTVRPLIQHGRWDLPATPAELERRASTIPRIGGVQ